MAEALTIRDAQHADLPRIVAIYNATIPGRLATANLSPVSVESREEWFRTHSPEKYPLLVAEAGEITGWASLNTFFNGREAYRYTAEISVYVAQKHARKGIGNALTDELLRRCPKLQIRTLMAFVFGHNDPSLRFFERKGFSRWGHLPRIADMDNVERDLDILGLRLDW